MLTTSPTAAPVVPSDRRAALKARHRAAILHAARELVDEQGGARFSVVELAERADIARRTVFNHFASIDEVLLTLCAERLEVIIDDFVASVEAAPVGDDSRASMFDEIEQVLRAVDLPSAIASIAGIIGEPDTGDPRGRTLSDEAFARVAERLATAVVGRHPGADRLDVELLVNSLMSGVIVIAKHWIIRTGARLDETDRAVWTELLTRLTDAVRVGYRPSD